MPCLRGLKRDAVLPSEDFTELARLAAACLGVAMGVTSIRFEASRRFWGCGARKGSSAVKGPENKCQSRVTGVFGEGGIGDGRRGGVASRVHKKQLLSY